MKLSITHYDDTITIENESNDQTLGDMHQYWKQLLLGVGYCGVDEFYD